MKVVINKEKSERWKEHIANDVNATANPAKLCKTIRSLDGRFNPGDDNKVPVEQKQNGIKVAHVEDKYKADLFAKTYKQFTRLPATRCT